MIPSFTEFKNGKQFNNGTNEKDKPMAEIEFDYNAANKRRESSEDVRPPKEPGDYTFVVKEAKLSKYNDKNLIKLTIMVEQKEHEYKAFDDIYLTSAAVWRLKSLCDSIGMPLPEGKIDTDDLLDAVGNAKFEVVNGHFKLKWYISADQSGVSVTPAQVAERFAATPDDLPPL